MALAKWGGIWYNGGEGKNKLWEAAGASYSDGNAEAYIKSCKADKGENGRYKKAYLEVDISDGKAQKGVNSPLI